MTADAAPNRLEHQLPRIAAAAGHEIALFSDGLAPRFYGSEALCTVLRQLVIGHERNRVRVLVRHPDRVLIDGAHRLVELARTIPSRIQIRAATPPADSLRAEWLIADKKHYLVRPDSTDDHAVMRLDDAGRSAALWAQFDTYWAHGIASRELAALRL